MVGGTNRALKFGPFPAAVLEDVLHTDVRAGKLLLDSGLSGAGGRSIAAITVAVTNRCFIMEAAGSARPGLVAGPRRWFALGDATATSSRRRHATLSGSSGGWTRRSLTMIQDWRRLQSRGHLDGLPKVRTLVGFED